MARIFEKSQHPAENIGEKHLACAVLIDTSGSMHGYEKALEDALKELKETIMEDDIARGRVEISVITFDDDVHEVVPFGPIRKMEIPRIDCGGMTCTHAAIQLALDRTSERKEEYKRNGMQYNQPWIWLFTDGQSNDPDNGSFAELLRRQNEKKLVFYGVGLGSEVDEKELGSMHKNGMILKAARENIRNAFEFLIVDIVDLLYKPFTYYEFHEWLEMAAGKDLEVSFIPVDTI